MKSYQNISGDSGVSTYEIGSNYVLVQFKTGKTYNYSYTSAGKNNVEIMKNLAISGSGL